MPFIGRQPTPVPLTSSDITDGIISTAKIANDAVDNTKLDLSANYAFTGTITGAGGGKVLQVVSNASDTVTTVTNGATTNIISQAITPSASSSKILIRASINLGGGLNSYGYCRLLRGTTAIGISTQASGSQVNASFQVMTKNWTYQSYRTSPHIFEFLP